MLGVAMVNWEHSWGKPFPGEVPGLGQAYKAAHVGLIRYAGGSWVNSVGWERLPQRTPYTAWSPTKDNYHQNFKNEIDVNEVYYFHYGSNEIDSLAHLASEAGAKIMIQVNIRNDDPAMWADMVHYANIEKQYGFKYWEIGNEFDLDQGLGIDPNEYASRLARYIDAMKAVDPEIIIVGGVPASAHDAPRQGWSDAVTDMSHYLIESAKLTTATGRKIDSLSYHWYQNGSTDSIEDIIRWKWPGIDRTSWRNSYSRIWSEIAPSRVKEEILTPYIPGALQGITELNFDATDFDQAPQESNHMTAVWMADCLGRLAYNGLDYVTWYEGFGSPYQGYPMIVREPDTDSYTEIRLRPTYYVTYMYGNYFGDRLVETSSGMPNNLSAWASTDTRDPDTLKLMITNISSDTITAPLVIQGFSAGSGEYYQLTSTDPENMSNASNLGSAWTTINGHKLIDMDVSTSRISSRELNIHDLQLSFPPYSVTAVILRAGTGQTTPGLPWNLLLLNK
jgi:hypothetical protein